MKPKTEFHVLRNSGKGFVSRCKLCYSTDIQRAIHNNINRQILFFLPGQSKSKKTMEYVGCDMEFLRKWLEFQ